MEADVGDSFVIVRDTAFAAGSYEVSPPRSSDASRNAILEHIRSLLDLLQTVDSLEESDCDPTLDRLVLQFAAKRMIKARSIRSGALTPNLFGEPAWDMLLALYVADEPLMSKAVCLAAGVPLTTAMRWLYHLEQQRYIDRSPDDSDGRRCNVSLTPKGAAATRAVSVHSGS